MNDNFCMTQLIALHFIKKLPEQKLRNFDDLSLYIILEQHSTWG
jgi:hypothetical protein